MDEKLATLRAVPLFVGLDDNELKAVGALCDELDVPAGHELTHEETFGNEFYMIVDGDVRIHRARSDDPDPWAGRLPGRDRAAGPRPAHRQRDL